MGEVSKMVPQDEEVRQQVLALTEVIVFKTGGELQFAEEDLDVAVEVMADMKEL